MSDNKGQEKKIGLKFSEKMSGYIAPGAADFQDGENLGEKQNDFLLMDLCITIEDVDDFCKISCRKALLDGTLSYRPLGQNLPIRRGEFILFRPDQKSGKRHMTYSFQFTGNDNNDYFLYGYKVIYDDPGKVDMIDDLTSLFTRIHKGQTEASPVFGSGIVHFKLLNLPAMVASFEVINTHSLLTKLKAMKEFYAFCYGEISGTYLAKLSPIYHTEYENLILTGKLASAGGGTHDFFFISGVHDKDFPWGDDGVFWDVALLLRKDDGTWARYVLTDRIIEGLELDVAEGIYQFEGPLYEIIEGYQVSTSELHKSVLPDHLRELHATIEFRFSYQEFSAVHLPFPMSPHPGRLVSRNAMDTIKEWLSYLQVLGLYLTPHRVHTVTGKIRLQDASGTQEYLPVANQTVGEAEKSIFRNIRWPSLYYNYFCGVNPASGEIYVKIRSDVLRENRQEYILDKIQQELGKIISHLASLDLDIQEDTAMVLSENEAKPFSTVDDNLLEINNDHFPSAVFQRRVVELRDDQGNTFYTLEEDMDTLNLGSINSDRVVKVAAIKDTDKFKALDRVLEATDFFGKLDNACDKSGKGKEAFSIIVKPNFMFMYAVKDRSTFTDPELVEYLLDRMFERGYRNLACAEARSTYGTFFTNREVKTVANHIGLTEKNYHLIDLSEDLEEYQYAGKLGKHWVNKEWKQADFRIAFAKNKTHSYALYTLTIKDIYGALPMENKFLEYHHDRDIYSTTIEYIKHFPIHFALIDAYISADGPFGIFADKEPNHTDTIIGSEDIVATDWIGAAKMGLDPMESDYMKQAVEAFGKPQIKMVGDRTIYPDWVNVSDTMPFLAFGVIDKDYYFGNLFYSVFSYMEDFFQYKDPSLAIRIARVMADPIKSLFFQKAEQGEFDVDLNKRLYELYTKEE